jgi:tetratricopeptide (TPR) repeat protein
MTTTETEKTIAEMDGAELFKRGAEALEAKHYAEAQRFLQAAVARDRSPDHLSLYALALSYHTGEVQPGITLCQEAVKREPKNPEHFLRLGVIHLIANQRKEAIRIFRLGLRVGRHPLIVKWLQALGHREKPLIPFLARSNPLNKYLGKIRSSLKK